MQANSPQASLRKTAMRVASSADTEKGRAVRVQISELSRSDVVIAHDCVKWSWEVPCVFPWVQSIESEPTCSHGSSLHTDILHFALHCRGPPCLFLSFFLSVSLFVRFLSSSDLVRHDSPVSVLVDFAFTLYQGIEWASWHGHLSSYAQELKTVCVSGQGLLGATENCAIHEVTPLTRNREKFHRHSFFHISQSCSLRTLSFWFLLCMGCDALTLSLIRNPL